MAISVFFSKLALYGSFGIMCSTYGVIIYQVANNASHAFSMKRK